MRSLYDYDVLVNQTFYRCWHILEYIENHKDMSELDKEAIKATIMDALVYSGEIDRETSSLDFDNLQIVDNLDYYRYEKHPNVSGIPMWMKNEFRKKSISITGGIPISMFLAKPPSKAVRFCVYDPNTAVSSIFKDATFFHAIYTSPTREGVRLDEVRPFVEVEIDGVKYLVDTITKRIFKSSWFKSKYDMEVRDVVSIKDFDKRQRKLYDEQTSENNHLAELIQFIEMMVQNPSKSLAEYRYEYEKSKEYFKDEWARSKVLEEEMKQFMKNNHHFTKNS